MICDCISWPIAVGVDRALSSATCRLPDGRVCGLAYRVETQRPTTYDLRPRTKDQGPRTKDLRDLSEQVPLKVALKPPTGPARRRKGGGKLSHRRLNSRVVYLPRSLRPDIQNLSSFTTCVRNLILRRCDGQSLLKTPGHRRDIPSFAASAGDRRIHRSRCSDCHIDRIFVIVHRGLCLIEVENCSCPLSSPGCSVNFPRNSGRAVTKMMYSQSVHPKVPGGVSFVGAGRRSPTIK
jgi:hypothetical protein